jgi:hypothetical protein
MLETLIMDTGVHTDEEVEIGDNATPRQRNDQALDSDGDVEFAEPYRTPIVLQRQNKKPAPAPVSESEVEVSEVEVLEESQQRKKVNKEQRTGDKGKAWVYSFLID